MLEIGTKIRHHIGDASIDYTITSIGSYVGSYETMCKFIMCDNKFSFTLRWVENCLRDGRMEILPSFDYKQFFQNSKSELDHYEPRYTS